MSYEKQAPVKGKLEEITPLPKTNPKSWDRFDVLLEGGKSYVMNVPPDKITPEVGETVMIFLSKNGEDYNFWKIETDAERAKFASKAGNRNTGGGGTSKGSYTRKSNSSEGYWEKKFNYDVDVKDRQISRHVYFKEAMNAALAATEAGLPLSGKTKAKSAEEIVRWACSMIDKVEAACKPTTGEEATATKSTTKSKKVETTVDSDPIKTPASATDVPW